MSIQVFFNCSTPYGFILEKPDGEHIDSCWGFYGDNIETNGILDNIGQSYQDLVNSLEDV